MIGTHNSFTYLPPKKKIFNLFSFLWRTQTKSISEQITLGVTYFDIRITRDYKECKWRVCHGLVDFNKTFYSIEHILNTFVPLKVRILLEKGNYNDEILFIKEANACLNYPNLSFAGIKRGWVIIINRDPIIKDYTYIPWLSNLSFWENIKRGNFFSTIKRWAKKHNPKITNELINDKIIHFLDYYEK